MELTDLASATVGRMVSRLVRRVVGWALVALFGLAALYQASVAAVVALETFVGPIYAHLIIAGVYAFITLTAVAVLWFTGRRPFVDERYRESLAQLPAEVQVATIVEALLLGYAMSRRK